MTFENRFSRFQRFRNRPKIKLGNAFRKNPQTGPERDFFEAHPRERFSLTVRQNDTVLGDPSVPNVKDNGTAV